MKFTTCFTLIVLAIVIGFTVLARDYIRYSTEMELHNRSAPILQIIPMPGSDDSEPDRPDVWREQHHKKGTM